MAGYVAGRKNASNTSVMLIKFSSSASGSITMFGEVAKQLLRAMGLTPRDEGAIKGDDIAQALVRLKAELMKSAAEFPTHPGRLDDEEEQETAVDLPVRAVPLLEMLGLAQEQFEEGKADSYIMWQVE
jgi:hypothetical protein